MALVSPDRTNFFFLLSLLVVFGGWSNKILLEDVDLKHATAATNNLVPECYIDAKKSSSKNLAFHLDQESFVSQLTECIAGFPQNKCHIMYQHIAKTGGTGLNKLFFSLLKLSQHSGFYGEEMIKEFDAKKEEFCSHHFQSYEVVEGFDKMVHTCQDQYYKDIKGHKLLLLISVREPISVTLSSIHHHCNKNWNQRTNETREACTACKFEEHPKFWMRRPKMYSSYYEIVQNQTFGSLKEFGHLVVDLVDMNKMIQMLSERLSPMNEHYAKVFKNYFSIKHNPESLSHCSFGISTQMIKALKPAQEVYRNFVARGLVDH